METNSSISRFDKRGAALILAVLLGLSAAWIYTFRFNPEVQFWKAAYEAKREWADAQRQTGRPLTVFSGGSTTAFQIDSDLLFREFGAYNVNAGFHAGMGLDGTVALATDFLKSGDRLVLMTEPSMLADGGGRLTALGSQMILATGRQDRFLQSSLADSSFHDFFLQCRPGLYHTATMLGKVVARRPPYRYNIDDLRPGGLIVTPLRYEIVPAAKSATEAQSLGEPSIQLQLSPAARSFLRELKDWTNERNIELVYLLPVIYSPSDRIDHQRAANLRFLEEIAQIIPVWRDSYAGAWSEPTDFADTANHMTATAAEARTRDLGKIHFGRKE